MANNLSGINPVGTPSSLDVQNAGESAISFNEQLPDLASKLRDALTSKFNESPLFAQRQTAETGFLNQPTQTRADISQMQQTSGVPLSPTQQQSIESARRSAAYVPLASNTLMMGSAYGGLENMVKSGTDAFTAAAQAQTQRANLMNTMREQEIERQFKEEEMSLKWASLGTSQAKTVQKDLQKKQEALSGLNETLTAITNARNAVSSGGAGLGGALASLRKRIPAGWPGALSQDTSTLDSALATVNQSIFKTAGKAFTATEAQILGGRVPKTSYQPEHITTILDELEREALSRQMAILSGQYSMDGETSAGDWEVVQ
jgi:hypothetical protein